MVAPKPLPLPAVPVLDGDAAIVSQHLTVVAAGATLLDQDFPSDTPAIQFPDGTPLNLDSVSLAYKNKAAVTGPAWVGPVVLTAGDPPPPPVPPQPAAVQVPAAPVAPVEPAPVAAPAADSAPVAADAAPVVAPVADAAAAPATA